MATQQHSRTGQKLAIASAKELQRKALSELEDAPILKSEKHGRLYAIAMLKALEAEGDEKLGANTDCWSADSSGKTDVFIICRTGPQSNIPQKWIEGLYKSGTPEAVAGFYVVFTEFFAINTGSVSGDLAQREKAGEFPPAGSVIYQHPKAAAAAIKAGKDQYEIPLSPAEIKQRAKEKAQDADRYMASMEAEDKAKQPYTPQEIKKGEAEAIEKFLTGNGVVRRSATAFLSNPYDNMAKAIKADKGFAEACAAVSAGLEVSSGNYLTIGIYLERAERNIKAAIRARKDGEKLLAKARKAQG